MVTCRTFAVSMVCAASLAAMPDGIADGAAACAAPTRAEMRERYERAVAVLPWKLAEWVPDTRFVVDWDSGASTVVLTNLAGERNAISLRDGSRRKLDGDADTNKPAAPRSVSPDGRYAVQFEGFDLVVVELASGTKRALTSDGVSDFAYGVTADTGTPWLTQRLAGETPEPFGVWSPDSRYFASLRVDQRDLRQWPILIAGPKEGDHRLPRVESSRIALPGDSKVPTGQVVIFDLQESDRVDSAVPPLLLSYGPAPVGGMRWTSDGRQLWVGHESRDYRKLDIWTIDAASGASRLVASETNVHAALRPYADATVFLPVGDGREFVLYSERDGRGHLYLHDTATGALRRRLTEGSWIVAPGGWGLMALDEGARQLYFTGVGREPGRDPYYQHLYRVGLDGGPLTLLTPENANHIVSLSLESGAFVDRHSTVGTGTTTVVRRLDGSMLAEVARVDTAPLEALGWTPPERFSVLAADGKTRLWGTLVKPSRILGKRCHPIVDAIYAGPQVHSAQLDFLDDWPLMGATAELGFVMFELDARGTPLQERAARNATWGREFGSEVVASDHEAAVRQLAERYDFIDADRAGIYGHSWGGYYTVRAMAHRPETFKVGIASAGSHDNYLYSYEHSRWFGTPQEFPDTYRLQSNLHLAPRIQGELLLAHGTADDDVHVINTVLMAGALADAGRPFDMLILPDRNHGTLTHDGYFIRRRWDHLVQHLLQAPTPRDVRVPDRPP